MGTLPILFEAGAGFEPTQLQFMRLMRGPDFSNPQVATPSIEPGLPAYETG